MLKNFVSISNLKSNKGFTLLEVVVALGVIIIGLVGVLVLINFTISSSTVSASKLVAVNLAQEGIELVRNIRDTNWVEDDDWDDKIKGTGNEIAGRMDYNDGFDELDEYYNPPPADAKDCGVSNEECRLYLDANGFYSHDSTGQATPFYRLIFLDGVGTPYLKITSQVKWSEHNRNHELEIVNYLYNWQ